METKFRIVADGAALAEMTRQDKGGRGEKSWWEILVVEYAEVKSSKIKSGKWSSSFSWRREGRGRDKRGMGKHRRNWRLFVATNDLETALGG